MRRFFKYVLGALAMVTVALISAFIAMRVAIHGREAVVPALTGLSVADATELARRDGLNLALENRFYSVGVAPGRILAQDPAPGSRVRREWPIRITESLGSQAVNIPDLTGESERAATISIRRLSLDLGTVAHFAVAGDPGVVLTQTPPANSGGVDGPRVSLLISDPIGSSDSDAAAPAAYVMPSLLGLTWPASVVRASTAGLRLVADTPQVAADAAPGASAVTSPPFQASIPSSPNRVQSDLLAIGPSSAPARTSGVVLAQNPQPGRRVAQGDVIHVTLGRLAAPAALLPSQ